MFVQERCVISVAGVIAVFRDNASLEFVVYRGYKVLLKFFLKQYKDKRVNK